MAIFSWEMIKLCYTPLIEYYAGTKIIFMNLCNHLETSLYVKWEKQKYRSMPTVWLQQCFLKICVEGKNNTGKNIVKY